jgi:hypothetical protein
VRLVHNHPKTDTDETNGSVSSECLGRKSAFYHSLATAVRIWDQNA